ncbi:MAG: hypothetical protein OK455_01240 [Thaumarchaeota archaeon]|nr:hypothetical protein [Nitrososphaerota archaeon]
MRVRVLAVILLLIVASVGSVYFYQQLNPTPSCSAPLGGAKVLRTQLSSPKTFGGVTEYALPQPLRDPNAPTVAPDGSVWFGEESVPGLAHFYPGNGTLVEYRWPGNYTPAPSTGNICSGSSEIWGVALWNGKVWAADTAGNQLISVDPASGRVADVKLQANFSFPYTLTPGPDGNLWFTELFGAKIGVLSANGTIHQLALPGGVDAAPVQIVFANSTTGYYADVGEAGANNGGVYSFNLNHFSPTLLGGQKLSEPSSLTIASGALWVALHGSSSVASYNFTTKSWAYYPSSYVSYIRTTLPYFVNGNGSSVWFNEHYGNKVAKIDIARDSLTEYSESSPPVENASAIGNTLTFALGSGRAWFAALTGNVIGYVNASYQPGFSTTIAGNNTIVLDRGSNATVRLQVEGVPKGGVNLTFSDSEELTSKPSNLTFSAPPAIPGPSDAATESVKISASQSLKPGTYTAILSVSDGLTTESSFLRIVVPQ